MILEILKQDSSSTFRLIGIDELATGLKNDSSLQEKKEEIRHNYNEIMK